MSETVKGLLGMAVLFLLGAAMICFPQVLWKMENLRRSFLPSPRHMLFSREVFLTLSNAFCGVLEGARKTSAQSR